MGLLLTLVLTSHLILVNLSMTGPLFSVWLDMWAIRRQDATIELTGKRMARWSLYALLLVILSGILMVFLLWYNSDQRLFQAAKQLHNRINQGICELVFSLICLTAYTCWNQTIQHHTTLTCGIRRLLAILAATNLLYHFPPLFIMLWQFQRDPHHIQEVLDGASFRSMMFTAEVCAFTLHYWLASLTTSAIVVLMITAGLGSSKSNRHFHQNLAISAGRVALAASVLQIPVGMWLLSVLPSTQQTDLLGNDLVSTLLLVTALLATWMLLQELAAIAWGDLHPSATWRSAIYLLVVILLMSGALIRSRRIERRVDNGQHSIWSVAVRNITGQKFAAPVQSPPHSPITATQPIGQTQGKKSVAPYSTTYGNCSFLIRSPKVSSLPGAFSPATFSSASRIFSLFFLSSLLNNLSSASP